jgi:protein TonB
VKAADLNPSQRLTYAIGVAALAHALLILGVEFLEPRIPDSPAMPALEIVLSTDGLEAPPDEEAEYFGTADQQGDGNTEDQVRARLPEPETAPSPGEDVSGADPREPSPMSGSEEQDLVATRNNPDQRIRQDLLPEQPSSVAAARKILTLAPVATSRSPKERFLSVNTRQTLFAQYLVDWKSKVERVGTLNFPDEARRLRMEGSPVLEVALNSDGSIAEILVRQSSGEKSLDLAAIRILRLASPFDPFPRELRDRFEILRFAYEWRFLEGQGN